MGRRFVSGLSAQRRQNLQIRHALACPAVLSMNEATHITNITRICEARAANTEDANVLDTKRGKPIQYFLSMGFNRQGRQIEYSVARYRGDQNSFKIHASL